MRYFSGPAEKAKTPKAEVACHQIGAFSAKRSPHSWDGWVGLSLVLPLWFCGLLSPPCDRDLPRPMSQGTGGFKCPADRGRAVRRSVSHSAPSAQEALFLVRSG